MTEEKGDHCVFKKSYLLKDADPPFKLRGINMLLLCYDTSQYSLLTCSLAPADETIFQIAFKGSSSTTYTFQTKTTKKRDEWAHALHTHINIEIEKEMLKRPNESNEKKYVFTF
jgi:hypothetical protein